MGLQPNTRRLRSALLWNGTLSNTPLPPRSAKPIEGEEVFLYIHHYYTSPRAATPPSRIIRIIAFFLKSRAENVMNYTKSRAQNVIIVVKSRAENVMIYFLYSSGKVAFAAF